MHCIGALHCIEWVCILTPSSLNSLHQFAPRLLSNPLCAKVDYERPLTLCMISGAGEWPESFRCLPLRLLTLSCQPRAFSYSLLSSFHQSLCSSYSMIDYNDPIAGFFYICHLLFSPLNYANVYLSWLVVGFFLEDTFDLLITGVKPFLRTTSGSSSVSFLKSHS